MKILWIILATIQQCYNRIDVFLATIVQVNNVINRQRFYMNKSTRYLAQLINRSEELRPRQMLKNIDAKTILY